MNLNIAPTTLESKLVFRQQQEEQQGHFLILKGMLHIGDV